MISQDHLIKDTSNKKVVIGVSGGVDSAVALWLLKGQGFSPVGLTLQLPVWKSPKSLMRENVCCTAAGIRAVKKLCLKLEVPHFVLDCRREFEKIVVDYFVKEYKQGRTPNPCMVCNKFLRFPKFFEFAKKMKADFVATGHYARLRRDGGGVELLRARDKEKDQSYFLALLGQKELSRVLFPIGDYTKEQVYKIAQKQGLTEFRKRPESQDFCYVSEKSKNFFLEEKIDKKPGSIIDTKGKVLGKHKGLYFYTIGQRKGIELPAGPFWVLGLDRQRNALIITKNKKDLFKKELLVENVNWVSGEEPKLLLKVKVQIRYRHKAAPAILVRGLKSKVYSLRFNRPQPAITPGQWAVFYKNDVCLGGGVIQFKS